MIPNIWKKTYVPNHQPVTVYGIYRGFIWDLYGRFIGDLPSGHSTWLGNARPQWRFPHENQRRLSIARFNGWYLLVIHPIITDDWVHASVFLFPCKRRYDVLKKCFLKKNMISTMCRYCYKGNNRNPPCVGDVTRETIGFFTTMCVFLKGIHNIRQHVKIIHVWLYRWLKWMSHSSGKCLAWKNHRKTSRVEGCWANYELPYGFVWKGGIPKTMDGYSKILLPSCKLT